MKKICFLLHAYIIDKFIQKRFELKSLKKDPLGSNGKKFVSIYIKEPSCIKVLRV